MVGTTMPALTSMEPYKWYQPAWRWMDVGERDYLEVLIEILAIGSPVSGTAVTGLTLVMQTANSEEGPWGSIAQFAGVTRTMLRLATDPTAEFKMGRFLRIAVLPPMSSELPPWMVCLRASAFIEEGSSPIVFNESDVDPDGAHSVDWLTYRGSVTTIDLDGNYLAIQPVEEWLRGDSAQYLLLEVEATMLSGVTLLVEGATNEEGPWRPIAAYTQAYTFSQVAMGPTENGSIPPVPRLVRGRLIAAPGGSGIWTAAYRINAKWS